MAREDGRCAAVREDLPLLAYDELGEAERASVLAHLAECGACREAREALGATLGALSEIPVDTPDSGTWALLESKLEMRIAPLRASRLAQGRRPALRMWLVRAAAVLLVAGLGLTSLKLYRLSVAQEARIASLDRELADLLFRDGRVREAGRKYEELLFRAEAPDESLERIALALPMLREGAEEPLRLYCRAAASAGGEEQQGLLAEICTSYPGHWLADEAFLALKDQKPGRAARLRRLDVVALKPLSAVAPPLAGTEPRSHFEDEVRRLLAIAERGLPSAAQSAASKYARLRAARVIEEQLGEAARARSAYLALAAEAPEGALRDLAVARAVALAERSGGDEGGH